MFGSCSSSPDSSTACRAAPAANRVCRHQYFVMPGSSTNRLRSKSFTSAEMRVGKLLASKMEV
jgi:hypothetical protein